MATRNEIISVVQILLSNTQLANKQFDSKSLVDYWTDKLGKYPEPVIRMAADYVMENNKFFPSFAEMRDACVSASRVWPPRKTNTIPADPNLIAEAEMIYRKESAETLATLAERGLIPLGVYDDADWNNTLPDCQVDYSTLPESVRLWHEREVAI